MPYIGLLPFLLVYEDCEFPVKESVSMPYIGLLPFLPGYTATVTIEGDGVNALYRASPISTLQGSRQRSGNRFYRVNALYRASPISTSLSADIRYHCLICVNALYRASPISTVAALLIVLAIMICVNALYRASPISTVPFKKPYKINGFRDRF
mgnify:FL=1